MVMGRQSQFAEGELSRAQDQSDSAWGHIDFSGKKMRDEVIEGLKEFQSKTGHNEEPYIKKLENAKSNGEIREIEKKTKNACIKWYEIQLKKSGLWYPMHDKEKSFANRELKDLIKHFSGQPLAGGDFSMTKTLADLEKNLEPRRKFRTKLGRQSKFVKNEYFRRLGTLGLVGSKEDLLNNILKELKGVEDMPSAVQFEFKKKQKGAKAKTDTAKLKAEVVKGFEVKKNRYITEVLKNRDVFGGELKNSPFGKIPETALEFIEWFEERNSFADMDAAQKKLPGLIKERQRLFEKRDKIVENALPHDKKRLTDKTNKMRRHELEEFIPELESNVRGNSIFVAEFMATIMARSKNIPLFQPFERILNIRKMKLADVETQKARLKVLESDIIDRDRVVKEYFDLPSYLRNDDRFIRGSEVEREKYLLDAKEQRNNEKKSPFDISNEKDFDRTDANKVANAIKGHEGQKTIDEIVEEMEREGMIKAAKIQDDTYKKIYGTGRRAKRFEETQKESYLRDLKYWVKLDQNIKHENEAKTNRQKNKWRFIEGADEAYEMGKVFSSGGEIDKLQKISTQKLESGSSKAVEQLSEAKYGEHIMIEDHQGRMAQDPLEIIENLSNKEVVKLMHAAMNKLAGKHMGLSGTNMSIIKNSANIQKEMSGQLIDREFSNKSMKEKLKITS